jgi:hypothetical protein
MELCTEMVLCNNKKIDEMVIYSYLFLSIKTFLNKIFAVHEIHSFLIIPVWDFQWKSRGWSKA